MQPALGRDPGCQNMQRVVAPCGMLLTCMKYLGRCFMSTCMGASIVEEEEAAMGASQHAAADCFAP